MSPSSLTGSTPKYCVWTQAAEGHHQTTTRKTREKQERAHLTGPVNGPSRATAPCHVLFTSSLNSPPLFFFFPFCLFPSTVEQISQFGIFFPIQDASLSGDRSSPRKQGAASSSTALEALHETMSCVALVSRHQKIVFLLCWLMFPLLWTRKNRRGTERRREREDGREAQQGRAGASC